ncbi:phage Gp37/Gp68 family protein [Nonomuraea sp. NPDC050790]|uniref:phage Gp37/Gp68 family protein n=1 Tax=Nonomuraea sp. NPDC050790 TaxID=3364371 RepID=UPI0037B201DF
MADTKIEWTDRTWNPTTGCDRISPGCDHCYALTMARRLKAMGQSKYQRDGDPKTSGPGFGVSVHADVLAEPLSWASPQRVFVNSMSDLFHPDVPEEFIAQVWTVMAKTPQHTYQVLTKRHARMRSVVRRIAWRLPTTEERSQGVRGSVAYVQNSELLNEHLGAPAVLPNVWLGVSVEDQQWAEARIPALLETPAAVRFISAEPLLGPVNLRRLQVRNRVIDCLGGDVIDPSDGAVLCGTPSVLDWVIVGGESGPGARPMHPAWARSLRDQCELSHASYLFKQWGSWCPPHPKQGQSIYGHVTNEDACQVVSREGELLGRPWGGWGLTHPDAVVMRRYAKGQAGRLLDERTWDEFPDTMSQEVSVHG